MNYISRLQLKKLAQAVESISNRDVVLIQGARQVGKTTLVEEFLKGYPKSHAVNLERDSDFLREIDRTQSFDEFTRVLRVKFNTANFDQDKVIIFIDEAQESEKIGSYVRFMKEEWRLARVILSGSSMGRIFRNAQRVPVGRYQTILITPFTFEEFLFAGSNSMLQDIYRDFAANPREGLIDGSVHFEFLKMLDQYLMVGGLPEVVTTYISGGDFAAKRRSILDSQEDDFVRKSSLSERSFFSRGLKGVANYMGSVSKYAHIYETKTTAEKILTELIAWNLVLEIEQRGQEPTSSFLPKRYVYDIGVAQDLREMPFPKISVVSTTNPALRTQLGGLFENALLLQLLADQTYKANISGWKKGGNDSPEIDFVWRSADNVIPLECKAAQKLSKRHWSTLKNYLDVSEQEFGILVSASPFRIVHSREKKLINLPLYLASGMNIMKLAAAK